MALLQSRVLLDAFESLEGLQLGKGITYAEEAFRKVLRVKFGEEFQLVQRELIVPRKTSRTELLHDPDGIVMRGDLADDIARRIWDRLSAKQKKAVYEATDARYRKLENTDFDVRTVFFCATVHLGPSEQPVSVVARVVAFALSGWWNMAEVRLWHRHCRAESRYVCAEYHIDGRVYDFPEKEQQPPRFLVS